MSKKRVAGHYLGPGGDLLQHLSSRVRHGGRAEEQQGLLEEQEMTSIQSDDSYIIVQGPAEEQGAGPDASPDPGQAPLLKGTSHPIPLSALQQQFLKDKSSARRSLCGKLENQGFKCNFDFIEQMVDIEPIGSNDPNDALEMIQNAVLEMDMELGTAMLSQMADIQDGQGSLGIPVTDGSGVLVVVDKEMGLVKIVGLTDAVQNLGQSLHQTRQSMADVGDVDVDILEARRVGQTSASAQAQAADAIPAGNAGRPPQLAPVASQPVTEDVSVGKDCLTYLEKYTWEELTAMTAGMGGVKIEKQNNGIRVTGPPEAVKTGVAKIKEKVNGVKSSSIPLSAGANIALVANAAHGAGIRHKVVTDINVKGRASADASAATGPKQDITITVVMGRLEEQEADIIVNTTHPGLKLDTGHGVSKSILKAAGDKIQAELLKKYPKGVAQGKVAISGPGKLENCKLIYHGALPAYTGEGAVSLESCYEILISFVFTCLLTASGSRYKTIAFPALGTGLLDYPVQEVVLLLYKAVRLFQQQHPISSIQDVIFVVFPDTKLSVKQSLLAHRQTHNLKTVQVTNQLHTVMRQREPKPCEIRVKIGNTLLQVVQGQVEASCDVTEAVLVLWKPGQNQEPPSNPYLTSTSPNRQAQDWKCKTYVRDLEVSQCVADSTTLRGRTLLHAYCSSDSEQDIVKAVVEGIKMAEKEECHTLTIPVPEDGHLADNPQQTAAIVMKALEQCNSKVHVVSVVIPDGHVFGPFVAKVADPMDKLVKPADVDRIHIVDELWNSSFHDTATSLTTLLNRSLNTGVDSVLVITSNSLEKNKMAARDIQKEVPGCFGGATK